MEVQLNTAFKLVSQPNNQSIKEGEHLLNLLKKDKTYPIALLHYMNSSNIGPDGKLRAAIELKLWCEFFKVFLVLFRISKNFKGIFMEMYYRVSSNPSCMPISISQSKFQKHSDLES